MKKKPIVFVIETEEGVWKYWGRRNSNGKLILYAIKRLENEIDRMAKKNR